MAKSVVVDIFIPDFTPLLGFKLFNIEDFKEFEDRFVIEDRYGRKSVIYLQIQRKIAGQKVILYCKKILIDSIDSEIGYYYKKPLKNQTQFNLQNMIPYVNLGLQKQKLYILPDGASYEEIYASLEAD
jgi:hypothetical protein